MARTTSKLRIHDISPDDVADDVERLVRDHIVRLSLALDSGSSMPMTEGFPVLRSTVRMLAGYAQIGLRATDWPHHGCARDAVQEVCEALYSRAGEPYTFGVGPLEPGAVATDAELGDDAESRIAIVLLAAWARVGIDNSEPVPVRALATLAGVDPDHVRLLGRKGEISITDGHVHAEEAYRWLSGRGVEGLEPPHIMRS